MGGWSKGTKPALEPDPGFLNEKKAGNYISEKQVDSVKGQCALPVLTRHTLPETLSGRLVSEPQLLSESLLY